MNISFENAELCKKCGGKCCKASGCNYMPRDFEEMTFNYLKNRLDTGEISIIATLSISQDGKKGLVSPILNLRSRGVNRPIVDLFSKKNTCSMLTETGCKYSFDKRPTGGVLLIPSKEGCYNLNSEEAALEEWDKYYRVLKSLVVHYTSHSLENELKLQIEKAKAEIAKELIVISDVKNLSPESMAIFQSLQFLRLYPLVVR